MFPSRLSISARLLIPLLMVIGILIGSYLAWSIRHFAQMIEADFEQRVTFATEMVQPPLTKAIWDLYEEGADEVLQGLSNLDGFVYGIVTDANGEIFAEIGTPPEDDTYLEETELQLVWSDETYLGNVRFGISRANIVAAIDAARQNALVFASLIFVMSFFVITRIARGISKPIADLAEVVSHLDSEDQKIMHLDRKDAIGLLAKGLVKARETLAERNNLQQNRIEMAAETLKREKVLAAERAAASAIESDTAREIERRKFDEHASRNAALSIARVVSACAQGDFSRRLDLDGRNGVYREMSEGLNAIGEVTEGGLEEIRFAIQALSRGDFAHVVAQDQQGVFAEISDAISHTASTLGATIGTVINAGETVATSSSRIAVSTTDIATRTSETTKALEDVAASLANLLKFVDSTSASANRTNALAARTVEDVAASNEAINNTRMTMDRIKTSSSEISQVVSIIQNIAAQTNMLALNAGVESARAGENGRGFGVIASEVRALSQRTAKAAENIGNIILTSQETIETGVVSVEECRVALDVVNSSTKEISTETKEVADASVSQSTSIEEIHNVLRSLKNAMQENSIICSETQKATSELDGQARGLRELASGLTKPATDGLPHCQEQSDVA